MNISENFERIGHNVRARRDRAIDAMLRRLDLQQRQSAWVPLLWFAAGAVAGGALIYIFAPTSSGKLGERLIQLAKEQISGRRQEAQPAQPVTH